MRTCRKDGEGGDQDGPRLLSDQQNSWKDEFVLLLVSAPVMLLIWSVFSDDPNIKSKIDLFFEYFSNMPMWFQILFISCRWSCVWY